MLAIGLFGCDSLWKADQVTVSAVDSLVTGYCKLPEEIRRINRMRWKEILLPNEIEITCK